MIIHLEERESPSATQSLPGHLRGWRFAIDGTGILEYTGCECLGQYSLISSDDLFGLARVITVERTCLSAYILPPISCLILCTGVQPTYTRLCMD